MPAHTILIDYENVQPALGGISEYESVKCLVFLGPLQKLPKDYAPTAAVEWIRMDGRGRNALDFLIAYHLGQMALQAPDSNYYIVSKDAGFDPLIRHIQTSGTKAQRVPSFDGIPVVQAPCDERSPSTLAKKLLLMLRHSKARPGSMRTLRNHIAHFYARHILEPGEIDSVIQWMAEQGFIKIADKKIVYSGLPTLH